jgi:hypothetical protein
MLKLFLFCRGSSCQRDCQTKYGHFGARHVDGTINQLPHTYCRLEQDDEDPEKSPTFAMDENIRILQDMRAYFESFTDDLPTSDDRQW